VVHRVGSLEQSEARVQGVSATTNSWAAHRNLPQQTVDEPYAELPQTCLLGVVTRELGCFGAGVLATCVRAATIIMDSSQGPLVFEASPNLCTSYVLCAKRQGLRLGCCSSVAS
jgi:hypothetical protein